MMVDPNAQKSNASDESRPEELAAPEQPSAEMPESVLVARAKEDAQVFGILYERYIDRIYAYVFNRVRNQQDAEDLTGRTFYRALSRLHTYEDRGLPFSAWLYRIAHNLVANWHRDQSRRRFLSLDDLRLPGRKRSEPETVIEQIEEHETLWAAIERLPADRKDLLIQKFGNQLSNLEIGALMGKSEGAIKSLYFRTLAALRNDLQLQDWRKPGEDEDDGDE